MGGPGGRLASASVCGAGHEKTGLPCQDAHCWQELMPGLVVVAVADGAGSAPLSQVGAETAAAAAVAQVESRAELWHDGGGSDDHWQGLLAETVLSARTAVEKEAVTRSASVADLATTLILVVAGRDFVAATQIGDGAVVIQDAVSMVSLVRPAATEYLNETVFLTSANALHSQQTVIWRGSPSHLAVLSDGLQMAALRMPSGDPHPGFFKPLFQYLSQQDDTAAAGQALRDFLSSPRLRQRTDDDVTLVMGALID
jgi:hypothetical protein